MTQRRSPHSSGDNKPDIGYQDSHRNNWNQMSAFNDQISSKEKTKTSRAVDKNSDEGCGWAYHCDKCNTDLTHQKLVHHHLCNLHRCQYGCGSLFAGENLKINHEKICQMFPEGFEIEEEVVNNVTKYCQDTVDWNLMIGLLVNYKTKKDNPLQETSNQQANSSKDDKNGKGDGIEIIKETGPSKEHQNKRGLVLGQLGYTRTGKDDTRVKIDIHDPENKRFKKGPKDLEMELENGFRQLYPDERRAVVGLANLDTRKSLEIITNEEITLAIKGLSRIVGNLHAGLYKRDPIDFKHNYIWIQVQLRREFDRITTEYSPDKQRKEEEIEDTIAFVTKQILDMFTMAGTLNKEDVPKNLLEKLKVETKFMMLKTQKLFKVFEELTKEIQKESTDGDNTAQLSETIHSETE